MDNPNPPRKQTPQEIADRVAKTFFGAGPDQLSRQRAIRQLLLGAVACAVLIPFWNYRQTAMR